MKFDVTILGVNSAIPTLDKNPTAQIVRHEEKHYLIDCGEGTQVRFIKYGFKPHKIDQIFISHLHGDHFYGLVGLLTSMGLTGRTKPMEIFSPKGLEEIFQVTMKYSGAVLPYPIKFYEVDTTQHRCIFEDEGIQVFSLPLLHRIPTTGFLFREKERLRKMIPEKIEQYQIPFQDIDAIKKGAHWKTPDGQLIPNEDLTLAPPPSRCYAFCSDTRFNTALPPLLQDVNLLYHESTFCQDRQSRTFNTGHSTAREAAQIAKLSKAKKLVLGHFSLRYQDLSCFLKEAQPIFPNTVLGEEGKTYEIAY